MMQNSFGLDIIPLDETERLQKLHEYKILDSPSGGPFKHIAGLAAHLFGVPIGLVSLVDSERVLFKGNVGMEDVNEIDRGVSLCSLAILQKEVTVFEDALKEPCLLTNPLVAGEFGLRFYAAAPLVTHDGFTLGSVCVVDQKPRSFTPEDQQNLEYLARMVMDELENRKCLLNYQNQA
jgi:GAF domain-containing protein